MTDAALLDKWVRERDAEAFRQLASRYSALVYATCVRVLRDPIEAEDAAQECFEALARTSRAVGPYVGAWLHRVATNRCRDRIKTDVRRRAREDLHGGAHTTEPDPGWDEIHRLVDEALNEAPEKYRAPLVAHFLENQSHDAVARTLGVPRATVTHRIKKGLELVRRSLAKKGVAVGAPVLAASFGALHATAASVPVALEAALGRIAVAGVNAGSAFRPNAREIVRLLDAPLVKAVLVAIAVLALGFCLMGRRVLSPALNPVETFQIRASVASGQGTQTHASNSESIGALAAPGPANGEAAHTGGTDGDTISGRVYDAKT